MNPDLVRQLCAMLSFVISGSFLRDWGDEKKIFKRQNKMLFALEQFTIKPVAAPIAAKEHANVKGDHKG